MLTQDEIREVDIKPQTIDVRHYEDGGFLNLGIAPGRNVNIKLDKPLETGSLLALNTDAGTFYYEVTDGPASPAIEQKYPNSLFATRIQKSVFESLKDRSQVYTWHNLPLITEEKSKIIEIVI